MKYVIVVLIMAGLLSAVELADPAICGRSETYIDNGQVYDFLHRPLPLRQGSAVLIDSSGGAYSAWTKMQECLGFNPVVGGLGFVCRGYSPTGILNVHQTDASFSFWVHDCVVYNQEIPPANGGARYPTFCPSDDGSGNGPAITMPTLDAGPAFGYMVAQYEEGGWWSSFWDDPVDIGPGNIGCHKNIGKQLPDGNVLCIGCGLGNEIYYRTMSADFQTTVASGVLATYEYWGFDIRGGIAYVFYYDDAPLDVYYQTTTDGVNWSGQQIYDIVWPSPFTNSGLFWTQMAVTDAGDPILVFDIVDNDDATYPWDGIVYVSVVESQPCTPVSPTDGQGFWGTIATGGNYVVVLYQLPYNALEDSLACHDQWYNYSTDNGATWQGSVKITDSSMATGLAQIAKTVDATNGNFFYFYGANIDGDYDPFWCAAYLNDHASDPHAWYVGWNEIGVGIEEETRSKKPETRLTIYPNPFSKRITISFGKGQSAEGIGLKIYDVSGRLVKNFSLPSAYSLVPTEVSWNGVNNAGQKLPRGVYFVYLESYENSLIEKVIKVD